MCDDEKIDVPDLETIAIFGFDGQIRSGLQVHPDGEHLIFPLGNKVSIKHLESGKQSFLCGHTCTISNIDVSKSGKLIASGQINHMGFRAYVIIWDWKTRTEILRHDLHKVRVEAICFTSNELYLITLGGRDDGMLVVYGIKEKAVICGAKATKEMTGDATRLASLQRRGAVFVSCGQNNMRVWSIDARKKKMLVQDVVVGKLRREYTGIIVDSRDEMMYVGTMTGDVLKIRLNCHHDPDIIEQEKQPVMLGCYARHNPKKPIGKDCEKYVFGVRDLLLLRSGNLIIGAGDGTVELVSERNVKMKDYPLPTWPIFTTLKRTKVCGPVSTLRYLNPEYAFIGTESCEIYYLNMVTFDLKLLITCNTSTVYGIAFPNDFSLVFATASYQSVRIWSTNKMQELLRIMVPNFTAAAVVFSKDGKNVISVWNDGVIRAFTPLTGKLIYAIPNAHNKGCSALTICSKGETLVTGGCEGQVRVWRIAQQCQTLVGVLKEHSSAIASVDFNKFDTEVVSASSDGTCIIWDMIRLSRKHVLFANTQFTSALYFPTGVHILASGSDRTVTYWEVFDGSLVRTVEASSKGPINNVSMNSTGSIFVSVGSDQIVRLWDYQRGEIIGAGYGHGSVIVSAKISPCGKFIVTGGVDGAVFIWRIPEEYWPTEDLTARSSRSSMSGCSRSSRSRRSGYKPIEHIVELESSRTNKSVHIAECPPVNMNEKPELTERKFSCQQKDTDKKTRCK